MKRTKSQFRVSKPSTLIPVQATWAQSSFSRNEDGCLMRYNAVSPGTAVPKVYVIQLPRSSGQIYLSNISRRLPDYIASRPRHKSFHNHCFASRISPSYSIELTPIWTLSVNLLLCSRALFTWLPARLTASHELQTMQWVLLHWLIKQKFKLMK